MGGAFLFSSCSPPLDNSEICPELSGQPIRRPFPDPFQLRRRLIHSAGSPLLGRLAIIPTVAAALVTGKTRFRCLPRREECRRQHGPVKGLPLLPSVGPAPIFPKPPGGGYVIPDFGLHASTSPSIFAPQLGQ